MPRSSCTKRVNWAQLPIALQEVVSHEDEPVATHWPDELLVVLQFVKSQAEMSVVKLSRRMLGLMYCSRVVIYRTPVVWEGSRKKTVVRR